jgi:hypothetical protein
MKFIDMDGVLGDFYGWAMSKSRGDPIETAVKYYKEAFIESKVIEDNLYLLSGEYRLLSSLPSISHILKYTTNVDEVLYTFKENKLKFADKLGIDRSNVIILNGVYEKVLYAKGNVLYDDWYRNIERWNEAGGTGILVKNS